jgi:hypothetical protein
MPDGEGFLWRPILAGVMREADMHDSEVDLARFGDANDALDVKDENDRRLTEAAK